MNNNDWYQIGEEIKRQVQNAIDTNDFTELSKSISETAGLAIGDVSKSLNEVSRGLNNIGKNINNVMNDAAGSFQKGMQQASSNIHRQYGGQTNAQLRSSAAIYERPSATGRNEVAYRKPNLRPDPKLFNNTPPGSVSGILWLIVGLGITGLGGFATLSSAAGILVGAESVSVLALPTATITTGLGLAVSAYGAALKNRTDRFRNYVGMVKERLYCSVEELAEKTGKSIRYVRRDLKKMMGKKMFLQGHLDKKESCFIASDAMYEQYMLTQKQYEENLLLESKEAVKEKKEEKPNNPPDDKVAKVLQEGRDYIAVIRKCNDEIPGEEMSEKLDKLELLVTRIFARVEEEPALASDMQKMLSYYLPTTQKLLEAYRDLDKQDVVVKNISETKQEIEKTIDTINLACEGFLDELFRDRAWDIQSDISVLNTMLKQDGYIKSDFEKGDN